MRRVQFAPHLPAYPQQENAAGEQQSYDLQQLDRNGGEADPQDRGGQNAHQDRFLALPFREPGGREPDHDRVVAGEHQIDHHDLEKRCHGL